MAEKEKDVIVTMTRPDGQPVSVNATLYPELIENFKRKGFKPGYEAPKKKAAK